ncbi:MAG TPA: hypothetical protein VHH73_17010, partial [Verrucomicrobiae bacterium]|nr:hypothetical protein [Verrucomicrobiae bacterium]
NTLFLSLSAGVLVSCISRHPRHAMFATGFLMLGIAFGPYLVAEWHTYGMNSNVFDGLDSRFLVPSPFFTFNFVENPWGKKFSAGDFYPSLAFDHLLGWLFLVLASVWLPHISKDRPKSRLGLAWEKFQNVWAYGARASREVRRRRLLDSSPLHWLAGRHSRRRVYPWLFLLGLGAVWGWIYRYYEDLALDWPTTVGFCFIVQAAFKIWYGSEVCQRLGEDRRSGAIELLLSTPLKVVDFARGQAQALRSVFLWPLLCLILIEIILIRIGSQRFTHNYDAGEIWRLMILSNVVLVADLMTLKWTGLWEALLGGSPNRTILKTIFRVLALPWIVIVTVMATLSVSAAAFGFYIEADRVVQGLWIGLSLANDAWWYFRGRHRFLAHFRVIASEGWNTARRAPPRGPAIPEKTSSTLAAKDAFTFREWSRNHRALASLGFLLAASFLAIISCQFWTRHKLQKYIAGMVAGGQPANHAGLMSSMPRYRPGEDAAPLLKQAMTSSKFQAANFNLWTLNNVHREISAETYERARVMVRYNREALTSAQEALAMPDCGSMLDWSPGPSRPGMGLWALQGVGQLVFWQAALDLQDGNADAAVRAISSLLQLARFAGQQPAIEALNARLSILDRAADLLELLLARQPLPAPTLAELDRRLSRVHDPASVERAIRGETAFLVEHCNDSTALANRFMGTMNSQEQTLLLLFHYAGGVTGLRERDLLDLLRRVDTGLGVFKLNYPERARRA